MWNHVKDWAQIAAADITPALVVALFGVLVAWSQLTLNRTNQRETTAKTTYREFLKLAVQYPDLSGGNYESVRQGGNLERYEWFVSYFLCAAEEMLELAPPAAWKRNLEMIAKDHSAYFKNHRNFRDNELGSYSAETQALIERAIESGAGSAASAAR
jgi:hypothetical protein